MSALHTLTEQYTDSEGEEDGRGDINYSDPEEKQTKAELLIPHPKKPKQSKKVKRLVSYNDNEMQEDITDEEEDESEEEAKEGEDEGQRDCSENDNKYESYEKMYGYSLPPEPTTKLDSKFQENITNLHQKIVNHGFDLNKYIQDKKEFRNPSIYDKLIQFCDINELGTNFPEDIYNIKLYENMNYEELAKAQKNEMDKLEKQKKENIKTTEAVKRKSKWDQQAPTTTVSTLASSTISTTKTIIISSTGQLKKKPKI